MRALLVLAALFCYYSSAAQLKKIKEIKIEGTVTASVDRLGDLYFIQSDGTIKKYNPNGSLLSSSKNSTAPPTLIEPWNPLRVFLYFNKDQSIHLLDRNLELLSTTEIDPAFAVQPLLVCPGAENIQWILDGSDLSLKKVDLRKTEVTFEAPLPKEITDINPDLVFMREYQNFLFLLDRNSGIYILNTLGKLVSKVEVKGLNFFNFLGEELCYRKDGKILLWDLYTQEVREVGQLSDGASIQQSIITDERVVIVRKSTVELYEYTLR